MNMNLVTKFLSKDFKSNEDESYLRELLYFLFKRDIALLKKENDILQVFSGSEIFEDTKGSTFGIDLGICLIFKRKYDYDDEIIMLFHEAIVHPMMKYAFDDSIDFSEKNQIVDTLSKKISNFLYEGGMALRSHNGSREEKLKIFFHYFNMYMENEKIDHFTQCYSSYLLKENIAQVCL